MNVIVYTNFPDKMFEKEFLPKLQRLDLNIIKTIKPDRGVQASVEGAELLIALVATMAHSQYESLQRMAKNAGVPLVALARQSSEWGQILDRYRKGVNKNNEQKTEIKQEDDMNIPSVPWDLVPQMTETFMRLVDQGVGEDTLLAGMRPFWRGRPLSSLHQLDGYIRRLRVNGRCPTPFQEWLIARESPKSEDLLVEEEPPVAASTEDLQELRRQNTDLSVLLRQKTEEVTSLHVLLEEAAKKERAQGAAISQQHEKIGTLTQQLQDAKASLATVQSNTTASIEQLREALAEKHGRIEELEKALSAELKHRVNDHVNGHDNTKKALVSLVGLMDMGLMTSEEAIAKLRTFVPS